VNTIKHNYLLHKVRSWLKFDSYIFRLGSSSSWIG